VVELEDDGIGLAAVHTRMGNEVLDEVQRALALETFLLAAACSM
jgi:hypothetical protein